MNVIYCTRDHVSCPKKCFSQLVLGVWCCYLLSHYLVPFFSSFKYVVRIILNKEKSQCEILESLRLATISFRAKIQASILECFLPRYWTPDYSFVCLSVLKAEWEDGEVGSCFDISLACLSITSISWIAGLWNLFHSRTLGKGVYHMSLAGTREQRLENRKTNVSERMRKEGNHVSAEGISISILLIKVKQSTKEEFRVLQLFYPLCKSP